MWLARNCSGLVNCAAVVVVGAREIGGRDGHLRAQRVDVDQQVLDLALVRNAEVGLVRLEVAGDIRDPTRSRRGGSCRR